MQTKSDFHSSFTKIAVNGQIYMELQANSTCFFANVCLNSSMVEADTHYDDFRNSDYQQLQYPSVYPTLRSVSRLAGQGQHPLHSTPPHFTPK